MGKSSNNHLAPADIMAAIDQFLRRELLQSDSTNLTESTPLIAEGYITSLQAVELVLFLEEHFQIVIPPEEVTEAEFKDLTTLTNLVQGKLAGVS